MAIHPPTANPEHSNTTNITGTAHSNRTYNNDNNNKINNRNNNNNDHRNNINNTAMFQATLAFLWAGPRKLLLQQSPLRSWRPSNTNDSDRLHGTTTTLQSSASVTLWCLGLLLAAAAVASTTTRTPTAPGCGPNVANDTTTTTKASTSSTVRQLKPFHGIWTALQDCRISKKTLQILVEVWQKLRMPIFLSFFSKGTTAFHTNSKRRSDNDSKEPHQQPKSLEDCWIAHSGSCHCGAVQFQVRPDKMLHSLLLNKHWKANISFFFYRLQFRGPRILKVAPIDSNQYASSNASSNNKNLRFPKTRVPVQSFVLKRGCAQYLKSIPQPQPRDETDSPLYAPYLKFFHQQQQRALPGPCKTQGAFACCELCGLYILYARTPQAKELYVNVLCFPHSAFASSSTSSTNESSSSSSTMTHINGLIGHKNDRQTQMGPFVSNKLQSPENISRRPFDSAKNARAPLPHYRFCESDDSGSRIVYNNYDQDDDDDGDSFANALSLPVVLYSEEGGDDDERSNENDEDDPLFAMSAASSISQSFSSCFLEDVDPVRSNEKITTQRLDPTFSVTLVGRQTRDDTAPPASGASVISQDDTEMYEKSMRGGGECASTSDSVSVSSFATTAMTTTAARTKAPLELTDEQSRQQQLRRFLGKHVDIHKVPLSTSS